MDATSSTRGSPTTLATSQEIRDRGSTFVGYVYRVWTVDEARARLRRHTPHRDDTNTNPRANTSESDGIANAHHAGTHSKDSRGPYAIAAWRCMVLKPGRTGLGGPDEFAVEEGCEDGGERWAGGRVLGVMKREGVIDAAVVVCRWFGGTLLGPVRFAHVETCAGEVCRRFNKMEEMAECVRTLGTLDGLLATLRAELAALREEASVHDSPSSSGVAENSRAKSKAPDYRAMQDGLDLSKAKRLIHARECAIKATKTLIEKYKT